MMEIPDRKVFYLGKDFHGYVEYVDINENIYNCFVQLATWAIQNRKYDYSQVTVVVKENPDGRFSVGIKWKVNNG